MWRANHVDASIWLITMATSALVNTELGLLVGVLVSAFCVLGRTQKAQVLELGRARTREHYEDMASYHGLQTHPGVAVYRYEAPIYYANQSLFKKSLYRSLGIDPVKEKARRRKLEKKMRKQQEKVTTVKSEKREMVGKGDETEEGAAVNLMLENKGSSIVRSFVIDCSGILFVDTAGVNALKEVRKDYGELGINVVLAQCNTSVLDALQRGGYYPENEGESKMIFFTIADAVRCVQTLSTPNGGHGSNC